MTDNTIEDISAAASTEATPGEVESPLSPGVPPKDHRIRVDPNELKKKEKETVDDFKLRQHQLEATPDQYSPTGRKKHKIYLYDYEVKCFSKGNAVAPALIKSVPTTSHAIREFMILRGIPYGASYRFRAFQVEGTKRDAGDAGYSSTHVPDEVRERRARAG